MYTLAIVEGTELGDYLGQQYDTLMKKLSDAALYNAKAFISAIHRADALLRMAIANIKAEISFLLQRIYKRHAELRDDARDALNWLFGSVYQSAEYDNVLQHSFGDFTTKGDAATARRDLVNIIGIAEVASLERRLKDVPATGFMLARNDEGLAYSMQVGTHMAWRGSTSLSA